MTNWKFFEPLRVKSECKMYVLTFTQIPQPMHSVSEIVAILSAGVTSIHSFPMVSER